MTAKKQEKQTPSRISVKIDNFPEKRVLQRIERNENENFVLILDRGDRWEFAPNPPEPELTYAVSDNGEFEAKVSPAFKYEADLLIPSNINKLEIWKNDSSDQQACITIKAESRTKELKGVIRPLSAPVSVEEALDVFMNAGKNTREKQEQARHEKNERIRLNAMAMQTQEEALAHLLAHFPDLSSEELHAGFLHMKKDNNMTYKEMVKKSRVSQGKFSKLTRQFYKKTGFTQPNRKTGGSGKPYQLDESRDAGTVEN